ncbi:S1C family serine protease [Halioxenophilus sp. WMMB6]|uniref:S1C family serine protease n=1 Tax=Halioxenophilus sp. WMMB6 TaxID=3073815 RepID=UPI00295EBAED|nr:trypsin-like peptidase domain-containing protein [Halioxenophilus sp. WMMB6]
MKRVFDYIAWPVSTGLIAAAIAVLVAPLLHQTVINTPSVNQTAPASYAEAVKTAAPSVVNIYARKLPKKHRYPFMDDPLFRHYFNNANRALQERMQSALGSGVIVNTDGYILTNNHVIEGAVEIVVLVNDGREALAEVVGRDVETDLAVLKVDLPNLTPATLGKPAAAQIGDVVLAIGNPFGVGQTVTQGIISATGRYGLDLSNYENYIQTDAAINPGNSGGALVDAHGALIGINTAILEDSAPSVGISFAIPSDQAMQVLRNIIENGRVIRGWLGVEAQSLNPHVARSIGLAAGNGVIVVNVYKNGPAHLAGLQPGDIITHIDDLPVGNGRDGMYQIAAKKPNEEVVVDVIRNGQQLRLTAMLAEKPVISG